MQEWSGMKSDRVTFQQMLDGEVADVQNREEYSRQREQQTCCHKPALGSLEGQCHQARGDPVAKTQGASTERRAMMSEREWSWISGASLAIQELCFLL